MRNIEKFDERQLWIRGDIFKHGFILLMALIILDSLNTDFSIICFEERYLVSFIMLMFAIMVVSIEMIIKGVYFSNDGQPKTIIYMMGLISSILLIYNLYNIIFNSFTVINGNTITITGENILLNLCLFAIFITYQIKSYIDKKEESL